MKPRLGLTLLLGLAAGAQAADPPAPTAAKPMTPTVREPLNLRIGDIRKYMMPNEYRAALNGPDADKTTVVVQGDRPLLPMQSLKPVPAGLMTYPWLVMHPLQSWRALLPDLRAAPPGPPDVVPPPVFRWGP